MFTLASFFFFLPSRPDKVPTGITKIQFLLPRFSSVGVTKLTKSNVKAKQTDSILATRPVGLQKVWREAIMYKNACAKTRRNIMKESWCWHYTVTCHCWIISTATSHSAILDTKMWERPIKQVTTAFLYILTISSLSFTYHLMSRSSVMK